MDNFDGPKTNTLNDFDDFPLIKKKKSNRANKAALDFDPVELSVAPPLDFSAIFSVSSTLHHNDGFEDGIPVDSLDTATHMSGNNNNNNNTVQSTRLVFSKHNVIQMKIAQQKELYKEMRLKDYGIVYQPIMYYDEFVREDLLKTGGNTTSSRTLNDDGTYNEDVVKRRYFANKTADENLYAALAGSLDPRSTLRRDTDDGDNDQNSGSAGNAVNGIAMVDLGIEAKKKALEATEAATQAYVEQMRAEIIHKHGHENLTERDIIRLAKEKVGMSQDRQTFQDRQKSLRK